MLMLQATSLYLCLFVLRCSAGIIRPAALNNDLSAHLYARQDAAQDVSCLIPCGPNTCSADGCLFKRSDLDFLATEVNNTSATEAVDGHTLLRRVFDDPADTNEAGIYLRTQSQAIQAARSITPQTVNGVNRPSFCLLQRFGDLRDKVVYGTTERMRGCTVLTIVSNRAFYMCHLYEDLNFFPSQQPNTRAPVGLDKIINLIKGTTPTNFAAGQRLDVSLFNQPGDATVAYILTPRDHTRSQDPKAPEWSATIETLKKAVTDLISGITVVQQTYVAVRGNSQFQYDYQGRALLEWDPDPTGQVPANSGSRAPGVGQWRLWHENAYNTGYFSDGLSHCLSRDKDASTGPVVQVPQGANPGSSSCAPAGSSSKRHAFNETDPLYDILFERGLERRTDKILTWKKGLTVTMGRYPSCKDALPLDTIDKFWGFESTIDSSGSCPTRLRRLPAELVNTKNYQTEHVLESQVLKMFLQFLCNVNKPKLALPTGYRHATEKWVTGVLMDLTIQPNAALPAFGFQSGSQTFAHVVDALGKALGTYGEGESRMALLEADPNLYKGVWFALKNPAPTYTDKSIPFRATKVKQRNIVGGIQFMQQRSIWAKFQASVDLVDIYLRDFDAAYPWGTYANDEVGRPSRTANQPRAGLRDLWCYFIDRWLEKVEESTVKWRDTAVTATEKMYTANPTQEIRDWIDRFLKADTAPARALQLPHPNPGESTANMNPQRSKYGAWNVNGNTGPAGPCGARLGGKSGQ